MWSGGGREIRFHSLTADKVRYSYRGLEWQVATAVHTTSVLSQWLPYVAVLYTGGNCVCVQSAHISSLISCFSQISKTRGKCSLASADTAACSDEGVLSLLHHPLHR